MTSALVLQVASQAKQIIEYEQSTYFKHFNLYKYCSDEKQKEQHKVVSIMIDEPQVMDPLGTFEEIIEEKEEEAEQEQAEEKADEDAEKDADQQQSERKEQSDYDKLDPEIRKMIDQKVAETEEIMQREVAERKKYLDEKLDDILNPKKDGKKKQ